MKNPIIEEIRRARAALAAEHNYDLERINKWAQQQTAILEAARKKDGRSPENPQSRPVPQPTGS